MRRHPNVHQHSSKTTLNAVKVTKIFGVETQPRAILSQQGRGAFARLGIAVEGHHGGARCAVQQGRRMPPTPERAIHVGTAVLRSEEREALLQQNGNVVGHGGGAVNNV